MIEDSDFRIATSWRGHRKRKRLRRRLGADGVLAIEDLWAHAADCKPDGNLKGLSNEDIADEVDWQGDADELLTVFVELRLVDGTEKNYRLHNWAKHQSWLANKAKRQAKARAAAEARWGGNDAHGNANLESSNATSTESDATSMLRASKTNAKKQKVDAPEPEPEPVPVPEPVHSSPALQNGKNDRSVSAGELNTRLQSWSGWANAGGVSPKHMPTLMAAAPFGEEEISYAKAKAESRNGRPNPGLFLTILVSERDRKPIQNRSRGSPRKKDIRRGYAPPSKEHESGPVRL